MSAPASRSVLLLCRSAPYGNAHARDALDLAMAFGAFEQRIALLLMGDSVLMLLQDRAPVSGSLARLAGALPDYGIECAYVEERALAERGLRSDGLALPVQALADEAIAALIAAHDLVLSV